jgi:hypothetical protein
MNGVEVIRLEGGAEGRCVCGRGWGARQIDHPPISESKVLQRMSRSRYTSASSRCSLSLSSTHAVAGLDRVGGTAIYKGYEVREQA